MPKRKNPLLFALKCAVSLSLIVYFLTVKTSVRDILAVLGRADVFWLCVAFSLHIPGLVISALRWQILIRAQGDSVPLRRLVQSYLVGGFFNIFLPSRIGGDIVRISDGSRYSRSLLKSTAIIIVERLTGILALMVFALIASLIKLDMARSLPVVWAALAVGFFGLALIVIFFLPPAGKWLSALPDRKILAGLKKKAVLFRDTVLAYRHHRRPFFAALAWGFVLQVNVILYYSLISRALNLNIPLLDFFIFIPVVHLILLIPITINGLGLREGSYMEIFHYYGIPPQAALSFSLIDVGFMVILGIAGGLIYVLRR